MEKDVIQEILGYLLAHPGAKDTIEGIEKYWLRQTQNVQGSPDEVRNALEWLTSQGWINRRTPPEPKTIYSLNIEQVSEIKEYLGHEKGT